MKKKGSSVDDRSLYTRSVNEQGPIDKRDPLAEAFKIGTLFKKNQNRDVCMEDKRDPKHFGINPVRALMTARPLRLVRSVRRIARVITPHFLHLGGNSLNCSDRMNFVGGGSG